MFHEPSLPLVLYEKIDLKPHILSIIWKVDRFVPVMCVLVEINHFSAIRLIRPILYEASNAYIIPSTKKGGNLLAVIIYPRTMNWSYMKQRPQSSLWLNWARLVIRFSSKTWHRWIRSSKKLNRMCSCSQIPKPFCTKAACPSQRTSDCRLDDLV